MDNKIIFFIKKLYDIYQKNCSFDIFKKLYILIICIFKYCYISVNRVSYSSKLNEYGRILHINNMDIVAELVKNV